MIAKKKADMPKKAQPSHKCQMQIEELKVLMKQGQDIGSMLSEMEGKFVEAKKAECAKALCTKLSFLQEKVQTRIAATKTVKSIYANAPSAPAAAAAEVPAGMSAASEERLEKRLKEKAATKGVDADAAKGAVKNPDKLFAGYVPTPKFVCLDTETEVPDKDVYAFPNEDDTSADMISLLCDPDSITTKRQLTRTATASKEKPRPADSVLISDPESKVVKYISVHEPCGPAHGGLICSDPDMICAARAGICVTKTNAIANQYIALAEYSGNYGNTAPLKLVKAIQAKREAAKATFPDVGTNLSDVEFRDFPMYQMSLTVPEASFMNGKVKVVGVVFDA